MCAFRPDTHQLRRARRLDQRLAWISVNDVGFDLDRLSGGFHFGPSLMQDVSCVGERFVEVVAASRHDVHEA